MKKYLWFIAMFTAAVLAGTAAARQKPVQKNPCARDGAKFCASAENPQAFIKCLNDNKALLTNACRNRVDFANTLIVKMREQSNCKEDTSLFCKETGFKAIRCLLQNENKLSLPCRKDLKEWKRTMIIIPARLRL